METTQTTTPKNLTTVMETNEWDKAQTKVIEGEIVTTENSVRTTEIGQRTEQQVTKELTAFSQGLSASDLDIKK